MASTAAKATLLSSTTTSSSTSTSNGSLPGNYLQLLLAKIHAPATPPNLAVLSAIGAQEHGSVDTNPQTLTGGTNQGGRYNLIDTTLQAPGSTTYNSAGVQNYATAQSGIAANASTLLEPQFNALTAALQSGKASLSTLVADANRAPFLGYYQSGPNAGQPIPFLTVPSNNVPGAGQIHANGPITDAVQSAIGAPNRVFGSSFNVTGPTSSQTGTQQAQYETGAGASGEGGVTPGVGPITGPNGLLSGLLSGITGPLEKGALILLGAIFILAGFLVLARGHDDDGTPKALKVAGAAAAA